MPIKKTFNQFIKLSFILSFVALATFTNAQSEQTAELSVTINEVITFTLDDANPSLVFDEASDFVNGVSTSAVSAGKVTASGAFSLSVKAEDKDLKDVAGNKIKVNSISVEATGTGIGSTTKVNLDKDEQDIISAAPAAIEKVFGLTYSTVGNDDEFIGKPAGDYKVKLIYTATLD